MKHPFIRTGDQRSEDYHRLMKYQARERLIDFVVLVGCTIACISAVVYFVLA